MTSNDEPNWVNMLADLDKSDINKLLNFHKFPRGDIEKIIKNDDPQSELERIIREKKPDLIVRAKFYDEAFRSRYMSRISLADRYLHSYLSAHDTAPSSPTHSPLPMEVSIPTRPEPKWQSPAEPIWLDMIADLTRSEIEKIAQFAKLPAGDIEQITKSENAGVKLYTKINGRYYDRLKKARFYDDALRSVSVNRPKLADQFAKPYIEACEPNSSSSKRSTPSEKMSPTKKMSSSAAPNMPECPKCGEHNALFACTCGSVSCGDCIVKYKPCLDCNASDATIIALRFNKLR